MSIQEFQPLNIEWLGKPVHIIREKLENLLSDSCNTLTYELQNWLKTEKVETSISEVSLHTLVPNKMFKPHTCTFQHNAGGLLYVHIDQAMLLRIADTFFGARIERKTNVLSNSDCRLQERIGKFIINWLAPDEMWSVSEFEPSQGLGLYATIKVTIANTSGLIHLRLNEELIGVLTQQLGLKSNQDLYDPFCHSLESTPVRLTAQLSKKTLPLSELVALKPDDILPIELLSDVPVSIGQEHLFTGHVAEKDGQLVLIINQDKESLR
ncbi:FliM/FliN family flagellar motor switch protein [Vibrio alginolyticus]|uniref:FliM/FliN family flagellar motor switch protein n=1 Tax=Vibrio sp. B1FLJ16 TaxID=2751178 RepID=UPI0015F4E709|nr:flagellar motor switch protein FliM [Vibrio sp. B1FLJ16]CAD7821832.1 Type III flagellar switch regulator (C-ring) FliN C-term [Vibrio sp. B1FLJ16]CAD7823361.1 Type III flagellar switch regulator (C-ring) FliN C-term [Vibrio sp. B1FLJ16]CAE6947310.1 Type III flagellar switch regulator (C-ring) FliN C-term [Vibrio sp. B1FLJ16]CAE6951663.1 Type III flagellar switch regulator (C-ring) FliN C-term [Vibrio sp. B1FLJ16]